MKSDVKSGWSRPVKSLSSPWKLVYMTVIGRKCYTTRVSCWYHQLVYWNASFYRNLTKNNHKSHSKTVYITAILFLNNDRGTFTPKLNNFLSIMQKWPIGFRFKYFITIIFSLFQKMAVITKLDQNRNCCWRLYTNMTRYNHTHSCPKLQFINGYHAKLSFLRCA